MTAAALDQPRRSVRRRAKMKAVRRVLDFIYDMAGYLAAASMVSILLLTLAQIVSRYLGMGVRGLSDYAGYAMAAASFLAFANALNRGAHVRIEMLLAVLGRFRRLGEIVSLGVASVIATWFAYYSCDMVYWSWKFGDISTGLDATPLWIPQCTMAVTDNFLQLLFTGKDNIVTPGRNH